MKKSALMATIQAGQNKRTIDLSCLMQAFARHVLDNRAILLAQLQFV